MEREQKHMYWYFPYAVIHLASNEVKRTSSVETYLHGLLKFTNYSIRLLAYTSVGDGVVSDPVFCTTEQDGKSASSIAWYLV